MSNRDFPRPLVRLPTDVFLIITIALVESQGFGFFFFLSVSKSDVSLLTLCLVFIIFCTAYYSYCLLPTTSISLYSKFNTQSRVIKANFPKASEKNGFSFIVSCICCRNCLVSLHGFHGNMEP